MKRENRDYKIKYETHIDNGNKNYNANPKLSRVEVAPLKFIDNRGKRNKLENLQNNSRILSNSSFKQIIQNNSIDAKIKHRKKREGD
ncbi:MAG: hypothetical protein ACXACC_07900 [Promethearchaeota archaeon]|jgi:hypothetical protein